MLNFKEIKEMQIRSRKFKNHTYLNIKALFNKTFTYPIASASCLDQIYHKGQKPLFNSLIQRDSSFAFEPPLQNLFEQLRQFIELQVEANYAIDAKNKRFVESELKVFKQFFDQVESTPLPMNSTFPQLYLRTVTS